MMFNPTRKCHYCKCEINRNNDEYVHLKVLKKKAIDLRARSSYRLVFVCMDCYFKIYAI